MKRGGLLLAAFALLGGVFRLSGPPNSSSPYETSETVAHSAKPSSANTASSSRVPTNPGDAFERSLTEAISGFYGNSTASSTSLHFEKGDYRNPRSATQNDPQFLIALVPDPVHTHLSLLFDRMIRSLQMAVQHADSYSFDRAVLPWKNTAQKTNETSIEHQLEESQRKLRESYPGLLLFRGPSPLFVFLVGEKPTSGINNLQFQNAIKIIRTFRPVPPPNAAAKKHPLLIMGPSFSGSLESLRVQLLEVHPERDHSEVLVYSGSTTNKESESNFKVKFQPKSSISLRFASFQQNDEFAIGQFVRFAYCKGYSPDEIAVLSEGDTAYGNLSHAQTSDSSQGNDNAEGSATQRPKQTDTPWNPYSFAGGKFHLSNLLFPYCKDGMAESTEDANLSEIVNLTFPREISFFRSAYEKQQASKQEALAKIPGKSVVPLNLEDEGEEGDAVPLFAGPQTALSQEAVMLGVVSELQKHHIKFTILLATNPVDQLFLARYLRNSYPQGRVVVTTPDLLLVSQEDALLQGVLGLNVYSLVPGQNDLLCGVNSSRPCEADSTLASAGTTFHKPHQDRLFESTTDVGTFNATLALLAAGKFAAPNPKASDSSCKTQPCWGLDTLPPADYVEYTAPVSEPLSKDSSSSPGKPLLWLTILGQDGYWPIAGLSNQNVKSADARLPISFASSANRLENTLWEWKPLSAASTSVEQSNQKPELSHTTPAWNIAYCVCVLGFLIHAILSCTGTFLANSEWKAQFANTHDKYGVYVMAAGAFLLSIAFVLVLCTRSPLVEWKSPQWLSSYWHSAILWAPLPVFTAIIFWDLAFRRNKWLTGALFLICVGLATTFQVVLALNKLPNLPILWSTRYLHFASGVSPIPPFFLLLAAGYWWVWLSLRGMSIMDLRRPRLPAQSTLPVLSVRMSDKEGEKVRDAAHPVKFAWRVLIVTLGICIVSLTLLDLHHPLQSLEGFIYDWGYCVSLSVAIAIYLGCLIRLTSTWFSYKQVLVGLDRSPLREAFSRMKRLSWKSMWNPGGSTLRETYRVMSRTFENLEKLEPAMKQRPGSEKICASITETTSAYSEAIAIFGRLMSLLEKSPASAPDAPTDGSPRPENSTKEFAPSPDISAPPTQAARVAAPTILPISVPSSTMASAAAAAPAKAPEAKVEAGEVQTETIPPTAANPEETEASAKVSDQQTLSNNGESKHELFHELVRQVEILQLRMADTAGYLVRDLLTPIWKSEQELVVSVDRRIKKDDLPLYRALAEEYAALIYVNFLQSVLLQMRTLVICAGGMYVSIVCSISVYPFEPHPALQVLAVVLLLSMGAIVGFVYAEMHRDAILSRLTSTNAGELGWDFWWKFVSAGAVPVFSLLAVQFPEIGRFLFSWLQPLLQSAK